MSSITLKRSAATLGVVVGLLAAAVPASASPIYMPVGGIDGSVVGRPDQTAPRGTQVGSEGVKAPNAFGLSFEHIDMNARTDAGTQVGSEGVKAPTKADGQTKDNVKAVVVLIGANDYGFAAAEGTQIGIED